MDIVVVLLSGVVGLFGVTSAVLGFIADAKRITRDQITVSDGGCVYPANAAHTLGECAILLLVVAQITASAAGGCCTCCRPAGGASSTSTRRVVGIVASVLSWVAAVIAVIFYWVGAAFNAPMTRKGTVSGRSEECYYVTGGVFVKAAVLSLVATTFAIMSCVLLRAPPPAAVLGRPEEGQHAVGLPQWPVQGYGGQATNPKLASQDQEPAQVPL